MDAADHTGAVFSASDWGRKVVSSNPTRVMWDFSLLTGSFPELGVLWAQWEGWDTAELHSLHECVFGDGVKLVDEQLEYRSSQAWLTPG